jgi:hypothetical protein
MSETTNTYVVCIENSGYPASLERRKIYVKIPDKKAEKDGFVRVVDESGDDYLFPARFFAAIEVSDAIERALELRAS